MTTPLGRLADTVDALWTLFADALIATGTAMQSGREGFSEYEAGDFLLDEAGRMESDGPDATVPLPDDLVRVALDDQDDSSLLLIAADVIAGCKAVLPETCNVGALVAALRDRAAQFEAIELGDLSAHVPDQPRRGK